MLVSFTQTYGSGREELFDIYFRDSKLIEFKNLFDQNIYSFHNCPKEKIDKFREMSEGIIKNLVILEFNNSVYWGREQWFDDGYTDTIRQVKEYLREIGCTHFFFSQDDTFSSAGNKGVDFEEFIKYIKGYDRDFMVSLYYLPDVLLEEGIELEVDKRKSFNVYKSTTMDFVKTECIWPMDDTPFLCTMDVLEDVYDDGYLENPLICMAEKYLKAKYTEKEINRFCIDKRLFRNFNIYGPNSQMSYIFRELLEKRNLI